MNKIKAYLLLLGSNPIVQWLLKTAQSAVIGYIGTSPFAPTKAWAGGLICAVVFGIVHAFDIWLQQQVANAPVTPQTGNPVPPAASHMATLKAMVKMVVFFLLFSSVANAGYLISQPKEKLSLSLPTGTDIYLMPIEGFDVGSSLPKPTYGFSFNEDLVLGDMATVNGIPNLSPIFGFGFSIYADAAGPINNSGSLVLKVGGNILGPDLDLFGMGNGQGLVPQALFAYDLTANDWVVTGGLTVFLDLGPGTAVKVSGN